MSERNTQTNLLPVRRNLSAATAVYWRSTGYRLPFSGFGYGYAFGYTGGLFTDGRSYRS